MGHYREWVSRKGANPRVIAYYSTSSIFHNKRVMKDFRAHYNERSGDNNADCFYVNTCIRESGGILKTIAQYIDDIYVIDSRGMEPSAVPALVATEFKDYAADWNFLVTKDPVEFQYSYYDKFSVIMPKGEDSLLMDMASLWKFVTEREKVESQYLYRYSDSFYPLALAIAGDKRRSIPRIRGLGWRTIISMMDEILIANPELDGYSCTLKFLDKMEQKGYDMDAIQINLDLLQPIINVKFTDEITKENIRTQFIDTPDYNNLIELNRSPEYFASCPINLGFLTRQTDVQAICPFKMNF